MVSGRVFCVGRVWNHPESSKQDLAGATCPRQKNQNAPQEEARSKRRVPTCLLLRDSRQALHMVGGRVSEVVVM